MILEIKKYPDPVLREKCEEVKEVTDEIKNLGRNMAETMTEGQGIGLAAPQIGELKRVITVQADNQLRVLVNPKIIKKSKETVVGEEGCLSFPGLFLKIKRAKGIELKGLDGNGKEIQIRVTGLTARVLQHEIDHLDGILFIDKIGFWQRLKIRKKLKHHGSY